jgi:hypothetical protein
MSHWVNPGKPDGSPRRRRTLSTVVGRRCASERMVAGADKHNLENGLASHGGGNDDLAAAVTTWLPCLTVMMCRS